ncbi:MAG: alpha-N-arabinofuranosidase [Prevotella sp.]|nr:alpha-N-arabinofuranosidase [Prevotella sp.]
MKTFRTALATMAFLSSIGMQAQGQMTLRLDEAKTSVSPILYGMMTEEINFAYEGGLYAQLLRNVSFRDAQNGKRPNPWTPWKPEGTKFWSLTDSTTSKVRVEEKGGYNRANPIAFIWTAQKGDGLLNEGYWGIPVRAGEQYQGAVIAKTNIAGGSEFEIALVSNDGKTVYASTVVKGLNDNWQRLEFSFNAPKNLEKATKDVKFRITALKSGEYQLSKVVLFPETFKGRKNGLRKDLMQMMCDMNPKFLRFPGGNYLEGNDFQNRFDWKRTVGNPDERPGHMSPWGYRSTDGLGLLEFLQWAEDCGAEPILGVFAGYVLSTDYLSADFCDNFVQDALDEIEYVIGGADTKWGAQRIKDGHPEPFPLHYVEIGNEDFFDLSGSYPGRYKKFYEAIKAKYPHLQIISTQEAKMIKEQAEETGVENIKLDVIDEHYYRSTEDMYRAFNQYDSYDRKGPKIFCGEWASREGTPTTNMNAALGDAAWMSAMERNSDIVIAHCYAPLFVNVNKGGMQWESDLIGVDALSAYGSPSYYAQCMYANHVGNKIVPVEVAKMPKMAAKDGELPQIYYSATTDTKTGKTYLKLVNGGSTKQNVTIYIKGGKVQKNGKQIILTSAKPEDTNSIDNPRNIVPVAKKIKAGKNFKVNLPAYSVNVLTF